MMHKAPSSPALSRLESDYLDGAGSPSGKEKESLAELWQNFLEQEAGSNVGGKSRTPSTSTAGLGVMSPTLPSQQPGQAQGKS